DNIVLKALAKRAEQRYPSVEAMALDLQRYLEGKPVLARPQSLAYKLRKYAGRHRWALASAGLVAATLAAALGIVMWQSRQFVAEGARAQALKDFVVGLVAHAGSTPEGVPLDVRQLLDAGVARGDRELATQPEARAELFGVIARLRLGLGDYEDASRLLERQAAIIDSLDDAPPSLRLESATELGHARRMLGRHAECIAGLQPGPARGEPAAGAGLGVLLAAGPLPVARRRLRRGAGDVRTLPGAAPRPAPQRGRRGREPGRPGPAARRHRRQRARGTRAARSARAA